MGYTFMYFLYNAFFFFTDLFAICKKKKPIKNGKNWVNTKFVTKSIL